MTAPRNQGSFARRLLRRLLWLKRGVLRAVGDSLPVAALLGAFGALSHLPPWLVVRAVCGWIPAPGPQTPALNRLLCGLPVYAAWYGLSAWWVREYCMLWVMLGWLALLPLSGLVALGNQQTLRQLHARHRVPRRWCASVAGAGLVLLAGAAGLGVHVLPIEFLRGNAPELSNLSAAELAEQLTIDERALAAITEGLGALNRPTAADTQSTPETLARRRGEFRRYQQVAQRLAWKYQNHVRSGTEREGERARLLQAQAARTATEATARWQQSHPDQPAPLTAPAPHEPRHGEALISAEWLAKLQPYLQPGDLVFTRANGYRERGLFPGYWSHAALYTGTAADLKTAGLDQDLRIQRVLAQFATPDAGGSAPALIEAVAAGVVFSSLPRSIGEADAVAVLRPKLNFAQRLEMIARAFEQTDKPYDFAFDFDQADRIACTELVAQALGGMIAVPSAQLDGGVVLTPTAIVGYWATGEGGARFEFVAYQDGNKELGRHGWASPGDLANTVRTPVATATP